MWRLFVTLYALIVVFVLSIDFLTNEYIFAFHRDALITDQSRDSQSWLLALEHFAQEASIEELREVFVDGNEDSNLPIEVLSPVEFEHRYPQAVSQFNEYNQFFLNLNEFEFLYWMKNRQAVLKIGPMETISELNDIAIVLDYAAWLLLAVVIFLWHFNLWRKLVGLERNVVEFGEGNLSARASEKPGVRVGKLNSVFNGMADKTGQLLLQNRQLIRAVSHELRAPISRLRCLVDLLDTGSNRSQNAVYLDDMSGDISELENLVDEILNYSRLEAPDSIACKLRDQRLKPVLAELLNTMNREFSKEISLTCEPEVCARIDEMQFRRAVGNLLQNAARYCADMVEVSVDVDEKNALVFVHVDDDGPGIPMDERVRIFEPFARLDQSRTRDSGGYGLGLAIVKQIAHLHGGHVQVTTAPLSGSRFSLVLPDCSGKQTTST